MISFLKYQGTGNDFVIITRSIDLSLSQIRTLCDRKYGVGADGLIVMYPTPDSETHFYMHYYNADGSDSFCGNGSRCALAVAQQQGWFDQKAVFQSNDGIHSGSSDGTSFALEMHLPAPPEILSNGDIVANTGSPHYIRISKNELDIKEFGHSIRYSERYQKEGINVNWVEPTPGGIFVRTYERGVEDETLSCGTGVTACALAYFLSDQPQAGSHRIAVETLGGHLEVVFDYNDGGFSNIFLIGPATFVFEGQIDLGSDQ